MCRGIKLFLHFLRNHQLIFQSLFLFLFLDQLFQRRVIELNEFARADN